MNRKHLIPLIVAAGFLSIAAGPSVAVAAEKTRTEKQLNSEPSQSIIEDAWLHGKLESTLLFNEHLNSFDIDTDVKNGIAYLKGSVASDIDRDLAGEIAKALDGISKVENELRVDQMKAHSTGDGAAAAERRSFKESVINATLTARVKSKLLANGNTEGMAIDVDSKQGVVTLTGTVDSDEERELAVQLASNTGGTTSVTDRLVVKPD